MLKAVKKVMRSVGQSPLMLTNTEILSLGLIFASYYTENLHFQSTAFTVIAGQTVSNLIEYFTGPKPIPHSTQPQIAPKIHTQTEVPSEDADIEISEALRKYEEGCKFYEAGEYKAALIELEQAFNQYQTEGSCMTVQSNRCLLKVAACYIKLRELETNPGRIVAELKETGTQSDEIQVKLRETGTQPRHLTGLFLKARSVLDHAIATQLYLNSDILHPDMTELLREKEKLTKGVASKALSIFVSTYRALDEEFKEGLNRYASAIAEKAYKVAEQIDYHEKSLEEYETLHLPKEGKEILTKLKLKTQEIAAKQAVEIYEEGVEAFKNKQYEEAKAKINKAYDLYNKNHIFIRPGVATSLSTLASCNRQLALVETNPTKQKTLLEEASAYLDDAIAIQLTLGNSVTSKEVELLLKKKTTLANISATECKSGFISAYLSAFRAQAKGYFTVLEHIQRKAELFKHLLTLQRSMVLSELDTATTAQLEAVQAELQKILIPAQFAANFKHYETRFGFISQQSIAFFSLSATQAMMLSNKNYAGKMIDSAISAQAVLDKEADEITPEMASLLEQKKMIFENSIECLDAKRSIYESAMRVAPSWAKNPSLARDEAVLDKLLKKFSQELKVETTSSPRPR